MKPFLSGKTSMQQRATRNSRLVRNASKQGLRVEHVSVPDRSIIVISRGQRAIRVCGGRFESDHYLRVLESAIARAGQIFLTTKQPSNQGKHYEK